MCAVVCVDAYVSVCVWERVGTHVPYSWWSTTLGQSFLPPCLRQCLLFPSAYFRLDGLLDSGDSPVSYSQFTVGSYLVSNGFWGSRLSPLQLHKTYIIYWATAPSRRQVHKVTPITLVPVNIQASREQRKLIISYYADPQRMGQLPTQNMFICLPMYASSAL